MNTRSLIKAISVFSALINLSTPLEAAQPSFSDTKKYSQIKDVLLKGNLSFKNNDILLFGRESAGVPESLHNIVDERITIPMQKNVRSLNVSSSVAIVIGEACRQLKLI